MSGTNDHLVEMRRNVLFSEDLNYFFFISLGILIIIFVLNQPPRFLVGL